MRIHNNAEKLDLVQALCNAAKNLLKKNQHDKEWQQAAIPAARLKEDEWPQCTLGDAS